MPDTPAAHRLIVALDVPDATAAKSLVNSLGDSVGFYKIGLELAMTPDYFPLLDWLVARGHRVFCDLKLHDIPATVGRAVRRLADSGAHLVTVHAGQTAMLDAAAQARGTTLQVVAVTALTSLDQRDLTELGVATPVDELVLRHARRARAAGLDGVVCSGHEVGRVRAALGPDALAITPGIRPASDQAASDQKRVMTPQAAIRAGASHIVVGRPIRDADDPATAAMSIIDSIEQGLATRDA